MSAPGQREWTHGNLGRVNHLSKLHPVLNVVEANLSFYKRHASSVLLPSCHCIVTGKLQLCENWEGDNQTCTTIQEQLLFLLKIVINQIERKICKNQNIIGNASEMQPIHLIFQFMHWMILHMRRHQADYIYGEFISRSTLNKKTTRDDGLIPAANRRRAFWS